MQNNPDYNKPGRTVAKIGKTEKKSVNNTKSMFASHYENNKAEIKNQNIG